MLYWMSSEFILVAASSAVLCQASVSFSKKIMSMKMPSLSGNLFLFMELPFTVKLMEY